MNLNNHELPTIDSAIRWELQHRAGNLMQIALGLLDATEDNDIDRDEVTEGARLYLIAAEELSKEIDTIFLKRNLEA